MNWTDFSNLTASQRTKLAEFAVVGSAMSPNFSGVTKAQARGAKNFMIELNTLVQPAMQGISRTIQHYNNALVAADDAANPPS